MRRKVREKGSVREKDEIVWESFRQRTVKNCEDGGKPAASNRASRRVWIVERKEVAEKGRVCERRMETEKGRARSAAVVVKKV